MYLISRDGFSNASLYICYPDGIAKENKQPNLTEQTRKERGSRKLNAYCISRMIVTQGTDGTVSIRTHTNHEPRISGMRHIPLPQVVREEVLKKYRQSQTGLSFRWYVGVQR